MAGMGRGASALEHLEKFLLRSGKGVGELKGMQLKDVPGKGWEQLKKTGKSITDHPRAAAGGGLGAIGAEKGMEHLLGDDEDDEDRRRMLEYVRGGY